MQKGLVEIYKGSNKIIEGAYSEIRSNDILYKSSSYKNIRYRQAVFADALGKGTRHEFELTDKALPTMLQVFYTYANKDYILAEVSLIGKGLKSNYMAVLVSSNVDILANTDARTLFVPFDNDTFIGYNARSMADSVGNTSSEVAAVYDNASRKGLVIGSVEQDVWKTGFQTIGKAGKLSTMKVWSGYTEAAVTRDTIAHGSITGSAIKSAKVFIGYFNDWRAGLETYSKTRSRIQVRYTSRWTKPTPFGWNSWGVMQEHIDYNKVTAVADFFSDSLLGFRNGNTMYVDLDSYWDKLANGGIEGDLSQLKEFASYCKSKGLQPGIYWGPFTDWGWNQTNSTNCKIEGSKYLYGDAWTKTGGHFHNIDGARALDPTHPGTKERIALYMSKFRECGFQMIKIDFLGHAAIESDKFYDSTVTTGMQAYKKGMEYLVDHAGKDMFIYAAISPSIATGNFVHARRIACDAFKSISDSRYTLNSVNYGWWQTFMYDFIDADHIVFGNEGENVNHVRLASGLITGTLITGDDYSAKGPWRDMAKELLQNPELLAISKNGKAFRPLDGNSADTTNPIFQLRIGSYMYVVIFNFSSETKTFTTNNTRIGLDADRVYQATELYTNTIKRFSGDIKAELKPKDAAIFKIKM